MCPLGCHAAGRRQGVTAEAPEEMCHRVGRDLGPNFRNFPKIFSKDLPMSDDLGIRKKFSFTNF